MRQSGVPFDLVSEFLNFRISSIIDKPSSSSSLIDINPKKEFGYLKLVYMLFNCPFLRYKVANVLTTYLRHFKASYFTRNH